MTVKELTLQLKELKKQIESLEEKFDDKIEDLKIKQNKENEQNAKRINNLESLLKKMESNVSESSQEKEWIEKDVGCKKCTNAVVNKSKLQKQIVHPQSAPPIKKFTCDICHEDFDKSFKLELHFKCHQEKTKEYKCDQCELTFYVEWRLRKHMESHQQEKKTILSLLQQQQNMSIQG